MLQEHLQQNQTEVTQAVVVADAADGMADVELTEERMRDAMKQFAEAKSQSGNKQLYATLTSSKISLAGFTVVIELSNEVQRAMLTDIKQDMLDELRRLLCNKQTQLEIKVSEIMGEIKAYKPADKFKQMAERNPALLELKKRFDLDIEY